MASSDATNFHAMWSSSSSNNWSSTPTLTTTIASMMTTTGFLVVTSGNVLNATIQTTLQQPKGNNNKPFEVEKIAELIVLALLMICIVIGNFFVCFSFSTVEARMKTVANYFIVSLAVCDILVGVLSLPFWMWIRIEVLRFSSDVHYVFIAFDILCGTASIMNLAVISLERLCAVRFPVKHRNLSRSHWLVYTALAIIWSYSFVFAALYYTKVFLRWRLYTVVAATFCFAIPLLVTLTSYAFIFQVGKKLAKSGGRRVRKEIKLAMTIGLVIVVFIACWSPFFMLNIIVEYCTCRRNIPKAFVPALKLLHYANSMMNPLIYAYRNPDYRSAFRKLLWERLLCNKFDSRPRSISLRSNTSVRLDISDEQLALGHFGLEERKETDSDRFLTPDNKPADGQTPEGENNSPLKGSVRFACPLLDTTNGVTS